MKRDTNLITVNKQHSKIANKIEKLSNDLYRVDTSCNKIYQKEGNSYYYMFSYVSKKDLVNWYYDNVYGVFCENNISAKKRAGRAGRL